MNNGGNGSSVRRLPLSSALEDTWYVSRLAPGAPAFHETVILHRNGPLDESAFRRAFAELVSRHEMWRTSFPVVDGIAMQWISPSASPEVAAVDLSGESILSVEETAAALAAETSRRPYNIEREVPLRLLLVRFAEDRHRIYLALHHLLFDALSLTRVAIPELVALYEAFVADRPSPLGAVRAQYADYTVWEREWLEGSAVDRRLMHWRRHLEGVSGLDLPLDRPRRAEVRLRGGAVALAIDSDLVSRIRRCASQTRTSLFQVMAAGFAALLYTYTAQDDISFGTAVDMRRRADLEAVLGDCVALVPLRVNMSGDPTFLELLDRVRDETFDAYDNAVPFSRLIRDAPRSRHFGLNPLMQATLVQEPSADLPPGWDLEIANAQVADAGGATMLDLNIEFEERPGGVIGGRALFDADLFDSSTVHRMIEYWLRLLDDGLRDPHRPIGELGLPTERERVALVEHPTDIAAPELTAALVHEVVASTARRRPDGVAVICGERTLSYQELMSSAGAVADRLRDSGVDTGDVVGVIADRSVDTVAALLGILSAGAAYLPLDPDDPPTRIAFLLTDAAATALVTTREHEAKLTAVGSAETLTCVYLDEPRDAFRRSEPGAVAPSPSDGAYVMYTSGSTGQPKGVRVSHGAVTNLMMAARRRPGVTADDVVVSVAAFTFDASVGDLFPTLGVGGTVVLANSDQTRDPDALARLVDSTEATVMHATPTTWRMLVDNGWAGSSRVVAWTGGEAISDDLAQALRERVAALWNVYGPTEATVWASAERLKPGSPVTVGTPLANVRLYVLGRSGQPVPPGVVGEVCIGGRGVADGYVNRDAETAERFVPDPFVPGGRMYRTADRGRLLSTGRLQIVGRMDDQLKLRGVRIEPGEIEMALRDHPRISAAVVVVRECGPGDQRLVAYVVGSDGPPPAAAELREWLRTILPARLVPSTVVPLGELPVNRNGKLDRQSLPVPSGEQIGKLADPPASPLEQTLARLWAEVVGVPAVDRHDDFFGLGGHSLLALELLTRVEGAVGQPIPVSWIYEAGGSVAGLARLITESRQVQQPGLAPVTTGVGHPHPRLLLIWPNRATLMAGRHLRIAMGADGEISSFVPDYTHAASPSFADLATRVLEQTREIQPNGPYAIGGYSLGGVLAYEIAGRLQAAGESVRYLAIVDAPTPKLAHRSGRPAARVRRFLRHGRAERRMQIRRMINRLPQPWRGQWHMAPPAYPLPSAERPDVVAGYQIRTLGDNVSGYTSQGHHIALDLFTSDESVQHFGVSQLGWDKVHRGPLRRHPVAGDHASMWTEPNVAHLATLLIDQLKLAMSQAGSDRHS